MLLLFLHSFHLHTPTLPSQWSSNVDINCGPVSCSGKAYYQYDSINKRSFTQLYNPHDSKLYYTLALYNTSQLFVYNSHGCDTTKITTQMPPPDFLKDAFFETYKYDIAKYTTLDAWPEMWYDQQEYHSWQVHCNNTTHIGTPYIYAYKGHISIEDHDYVEWRFKDVQTGPSSQVEHYYNIPDICKK